MQSLAANPLSDSHVQSRVAGSINYVVMLSTSLVSVLKQPQNELQVNPVVLQ